MSGIGVDITPRSIATIAREIRRDWKAPYFGAVPYLDAMRKLDTMQDNAANWRGPVAKRVKAELKAMMKDAK